MISVIFDLASKMVTGLNRDPRPFEFSMDVPKETELVKVSEVEIKGKSEHKVDDQGRHLYMKPTDDGFEEVTQDKEAAEFEYITRTISYVNEEDQLVEEEVTAKEPTKYVHYKPVMVPVTKKTVTEFSENPYIFSYDEVAEAKKKGLSKKNLLDVVFFTESMDSRLFKTEECNADFAVGELLLPQEGHATLQPIQLKVPTDTLQLYIESLGDVVVEIGSSEKDVKPITSNTVIFEKPVNEIFIKLSNLEAKRKKVSCLAILA